MKYQKEFEEAFLAGRTRTLLLGSQLDVGADGKYFNPNMAKEYGLFVKNEELKKAICLLEEIKKLTTEYHERESYFATKMVIQILPEIGRFLREVKA